MAGFIFLSGTRGMELGNSWAIRVVFFLVFSSFFVFCSFFKLDGWDGTEDRIRDSPDSASPANSISTGFTYISGKQDSTLLSLPERLYIDDDNTGCKI